MNTLRRLAIAAASTLLSLAAPHASAWTRDTLPLWPQDTTVTLAVHSVSVPSFQSRASWPTTVLEAANAWNPNMARLQLATTTASGTPADGNNVNDVFFASTIYGDAFDASTLAVTLSMADSEGPRLETDVIANTAVSWDVFTGNNVTSRTDLRRVLIHEFGHVLGLSHPDQATPKQFVFAIMNSTAGNVFALQADDKLGIGSLYGFTATNPSPAPTITAQPQSLSVYAGDPFTLSVTASGGTLSYVWSKDTFPVTPAETGATLTRSQATANDAGSYTVAISNTLGSVTSDAAVVTVTVHPAESLLPGSTGASWNARRTLGWFGNFYANRAPWIYHEQIGWLYASGSAPSGLFLYHPSLGWLWTKDTVFPRLYSFRTSNWLHYQSVGGQAWFYNYATNAWQRG